MAELKPCRKCGSKVLALGKPYKYNAPRWLRMWRLSHGVVCVMCGYYEPFVFLWNRRENDE